MESGEYAFLGRNELRKCDEKHFDVIPTDLFSDLQDGTYKKIDENSQEELSAGVDDDQRQVAPSKEEADQEVDINKLLGLVGKYLYETKTRNVKSLTKKPRRKTLFPNYAKGEVVGKQENSGISHNTKRNWKRLSIYPFINFLREFRRKIPKGSSPDSTKTRALEVWEKMQQEEKLPFYKKAVRAKEKGYVE